MTLLGSPCHLASLGSWIIGWQSFALHLIYTYEWLHTMFVYLDLGYLTQDVFLSSAIRLHANFKMSLFLPLSSTPLCKCTAFSLSIL